MKLTASIAVLAAALTAFSVTAAGAATERTASAAARQFEGTVVSVNRDARTFRLKDVERGTVRIKVTRNTRFERIDGLAGLKAGAKQGPDQLSLLAHLVTPPVSSPCSAR